MGANLDSRTYLTDDKKRIQSQWDADVDQSQSMDGTSYSGSIGMLGQGIDFKKTIHDTHEKAHDFLSESHRKWSGAWGVAFRIKPEKNTAYVKKAKEKLEDITRKIQRNRQNIINRVKDGASKFVTCKDCKSKLNRSYLPITPLRRTISCPICNNSFETEADITKLTVLRKKMLAARLYLGEMEVKAAKNGKIGYIVGGLCPS